MELAQQVNHLLGLQLTPAQTRQLDRYQQELLEWSERMNLTAIRDPEKVRTKHFLDSLSCYLALRDTPIGRVIDVGSGAGFPGLPLKILLPQMRLTLVESVGKKATFLHHMVQTLNLENVDIIQERVETLGQTRLHRQNYDWALSRAVAVMPVLVEYMLPLVRVGGRALAMKGESARVETQQAERAIRVLGGELRKLITVDLPGVPDERYLVVIDKCAATPPGYPRRVGLPAKRPI